MSIIYENIKMSNETDKRKTREEEGMRSRKETEADLFPPRWVATRRRDPSSDTLFFSQFGGATPVRVAISTAQIPWP